MVNWQVSTCCHRGACDHSPGPVPDIQNTEKAPVRLRQSRLPAAPCTSSSTLTIVTGPAGPAPLDRVQSRASLGSSFRESKHHASGVSYPHNFKNKQKRGWDSAPIPSLPQRLDFLLFRRRLRMSSLSSCLPGGREPSPQESQYQPRSVLGKCTPLLE